MEGKGPGNVPKPTGANKRKGQNPVKQIVQEVNNSERSGFEIGPLDLSVRAAENGLKSKKVILSVPQYKSVTNSIHSRELSGQPDSPANLNTKIESSSLSVTPVFKEEFSDPKMEVEVKSEFSKNNFALNSLLNNQTQSFFSLEHFKQASLIFQKTALNGNTGCLKNEFLQHSIWNNLVSSTVAASESLSDEKRKIHKCDFPNCDKVYTKSSHLKAHKRKRFVELNA